MRAFLILNVGSSSVKFAVYGADSVESRAIVRGAFEAVDASSRFNARDHGGNALVAQEISAPFTSSGALARIIDWLSEQDLIANLAGAGHRVVHGGTAFVSPIVVTPEALTRLSALAPMAPYHQP